MSDDRMYDHACAVCHRTFFAYKFEVCTECRLGALIAAVERIMTTLENDPATLEMLQEAIDEAKG